MVKVERTLPAPASLLTESRKENGNYALIDVVQQLRQDFHDKCYVCEMKNLQDPQIEHLLPHKNGKYKEREFDWKNLFWSCGHCNSVKNQKKYEGRILDCCEVDPEKALSFNIESISLFVLFICSASSYTLNFAINLPPVYSSYYPSSISRCFLIPFANPASVTASEARNSFPIAWPRVSLSSKKYIGTL